MALPFYVKAFFADSSGMMPVNNHAKTLLHINKISGPVKKVNDSTFEISFDRVGFNNRKRSNDIWLVAINEGDEKYKSIVQQAHLHFPLFINEGKEQQITFNAIPNQKGGIKSIRLRGLSDAGMRVHFYVKEGPAEVVGSRLFFTKIPPRAKFPVKVTVVAWQYGNRMLYRLQSAQPVENTFYVTE